MQCARAEDLEPSPDSVDVPLPSSRLNNSLGGSTQTSNSTTYHEEEPLESFKHRVIELAREFFKVSGDQIEVEYIKGGAYNRIVGITIMEARSTLHRSCGLPMTTQKTLNLLPIMSPFSSSPSRI
jgi:hypothetical protein